MRGSYRSAERIFIWFTIPFFAYPIAAILAHPDWARSRQGDRRCRTLHTSSAYLLLLIATVGTTITPYMQLYLQSAVVERGVREDELPDEEREAVSGAVFANVIAAFIIIATGATLFTHGIHDIGSAAEAARALHPVRRALRRGAVRHRPARREPARRAILPIATSYVVSESLGYEKGVGRRREEAPVFVNIITAMILISAIVAMIPGRAGDLAARRRAGRQRAAAADQPVLHLAPVALAPRDGRAPQPRRCWTPPRP